MKFMMGGQIGINTQRWDSWRGNGRFCLAAGLNLMLYKAGDQVCISDKPRGNTPPFL